MIAVVAGWGAARMARVRYMVDDVDAAVDFYVSRLGFELQQQFGAAIAILVHGDLELLVAGREPQQPNRCQTGPCPVLEGVGLGLS
jgi:catechol 2,3-dioxygenase-like lactoylglutathione lyase family enzyme